MAITSSLGYGGPIDENDIPQWGQAFQGTYGVLGPDDWKVTAKTGFPRTLVVAAGGGFGKRIFDTNDEVEVAVALDPEAAGNTRWDLVVAHRNTNGPGGTTTFSYVKGVVNGAKTSAITSRKRFEVNNTQDDQPLALVQITGNASGGTIGQIIDMRVWVIDGGAHAESELALQYLTAIGASVWVGETLWHCGRSPLSGAPAWKPHLLQSPINLLPGTGLTGNPPAGAAFYMSAGTWVTTTDAYGYGRITWPTPFPNGLLSYSLVNGDDAAGNALIFGASGAGASHGGSAYGTKQDVVYRLWGPNGGGQYVVLPGFHHRVNFIAIGW